MLKVWPKLVGVWEGTMTQVDSSGHVTDRRRMHIVQRLEDGYKWRQVNSYTWDDGRTVTIPVAGDFTAEGRLILENDRFKGAGWESGDNAIVEWEYKDEPGTRSWELISLPTPTHRVRTWQHTRNGQLEGITIIDEHKVAE
jgi:hypothetical protein